MPRNVRCVACGLVLLGFEPLGPTPIEYDACPQCGGEEFRFD